MNSPALEMLQASVPGAGPVGSSQTGNVMPGGEAGDFSELLAGVIGGMQIPEENSVPENDDIVVLAQAASLAQPVESPVVPADTLAAQEDAAVDPVQITSTGPVPDWTAADEAEVQQLFGDYVADGDIAGIGDDRVIIRPFQKVAGDLFAQWAAEGKLDVTVERSQPLEKGLEMSQAGQMIAVNLMKSREHAGADWVNPLISGREATSGLDFSVRGSAFRFNPEIGNDTRFGFAGLGGESQIPSSLTSTATADAGQGATTGDEQFSESMMERSAEDIALSSEDGTFASALHSQGPVHAASARPVEVIDTPRVAERVISQIVQDVKVHLKDGSGKVIMRLDPPELGSLKVEITSHAGIVTADLQSGNHAVRSLLETHLPALKDALENAGIKVDSFNVSTGANFDQSADHRQDNWQQPRHASHAGRFVESDPVPGLAFTPAWAAAQSTAGYSWLA